MSERKGYGHMSERGRLVAEFMELSARYDAEQHWQENVPGYVAPPLLGQDIATRFHALTGAEKFAVNNLRDFSPLDKSWDRWLKQHLEKHPSDAIDLFFIQEHFVKGSISGYVLEHYGLVDRPWKMDHGDLVK